MIPERLTALMKKQGKLETYTTGQVFHSQHFAETLFMLEEGFVKRYQVTNGEERVIELIYGPGHIFPLSQLYKKLFGVEQNQMELVYVYQAMTDIKILSMGDDQIVEELEQEPRLFIDLFYESGLRLKSNIERLASNALKDDYKKVAHQIASLADEFGEEVSLAGKKAIRIAVPLEPIDMAEQLNISPAASDAILSSLSKSKLIAIEGNTITIPDIDMLKDIYL